MPRAIAQLLVVALVLGAPNASALDVDVRVNMLGKYQDLGGRETSSRTPEDISVKVGPDIRLRPTQAGRFDFDFGYRPEFEYFFTNRQFNDNQVDHFLNARFSYRVGNRTTLYGSDVFSLVNNPRRDVAETPDLATGEADLSLRNERNIFNNLNLGIRHVFTPRISGTFSLTHSLRTSENERQSDSNGLSGGGNLSYTFSSRSSIGLGFNAARQTFAESEARGAGGSTSFRFFGTYSHLFTPTLSFSTSAGPLWIKPDAAETSGTGRRAPRFLFSAAFFCDSEGFPPCDDLPAPEDAFVAELCTPVGGGLFTLPCSGARFLLSSLGPPFDPAQISNAIANGPIDELTLDASQERQNQGSISLFVNMTLNKRWERSQLGFTLSRDESQAIGDGISAVTTRGTLNWSWEPGEDWRVRASFSYSMRESAADTFRSVRLLRPSTSPGLETLAETAPPGLAAVIDDRGGNLDTMLFQARAERRLTRRLRGFVTFLWRDQSSSSEGRVLTKTQDFSGTIGLVYQFPTLHF